jgi:hypothetical protein
MGAGNRKSGFIWTPFSIMPFTLGDLGIYDASSIWMDHQLFILHPMENSFRFE